MKRIILFLMVLILAFSVSAQNADKNESGRQAEMLAQNTTSGEGGPVAVPIMYRNLSQVRERIQNRSIQLNQTAERVRERLKEMYKNQNRVRLAVHAMLALEDHVGGIGRNISAVAKEFNNSVQSTLRLEEKIQNRSGIRRFFAGGDAKSAEEIEQEVQRNEQRIQNLNRLRDQCECDEEVKAMLREHIQEMQEEQNRLRQLAQEEKSKKGLFGWIWK